MRSTILGARIVGRAISASSGVLPGDHAACWAVDTIAGAEDLSMPWVPPNVSTSFTTRLPFVRRPGTRAAQGGPSELGWSQARPERVNIQVRTGSVFICRRHASVLIFTQCTAHPSQQEPHHRPCGVGASNLGKARGGEHGHGAGIDSRPSYSTGAQGRHIARSTLHGRSPVPPGELAAAIH